jgi:mannosyltransferase
MPNNGTPVDYQAAAAVIAANERPGDVIAYQTGDENHYQVDTAMAYYLGSKLPPAIFQAQSQVEANSLQPNECEDPSPCITGTPRVWVVYVDHLAADPFSALPTATETTSTGPVTVSEGGFLQTLGYQVQTTWQENGITVDLLTV